MMGIARIIFRSEKIIDERNMTDRTAGMSENVLDAFTRSLPKRN